MIMLRALTLALPFTLFMVLQPANAQGLGLPMGALWDTYVTLTRTDLDMIGSALDQQMHNKKAGTSASWKNSESGNYGTVTLLGAFSRQGHRCERIEYRMSPPQGTPSDRFTLTSCQQSDGSWKLAS
jgi:surface antigen